jgi:hypothetical protein
MRFDIDGAVFPQETAQFDPARMKMPPGGCGRKRGGGCVHGDPGGWCVMMHRSMQDNLAV